MQNIVTFRSRRRIEAFACVSLSALVSVAQPALGAEAPVSIDEAAHHGSAQDQVIVTGTRRAERILADSNVPVDIVSSQALSSVSAVDLNDKLARLVPSFNVRSLPGSDAATFFRPASLRGLSPDQTLVLVNGKRRHRSAYIDNSGEGAQAADLSQIPQIALGQVEVLRDGASAQYGSDAIAGVINLLLYDKPGYAFNIQAGQYYEGDGKNIQASGRAGFALGNRGVFVISGEYNNAGYTDRGAAVNRWGLPRLTSGKVFANWRYDIGENTELYGFGNYGSSRGRNDFLFRQTNATIFKRSYYQDNAPSIYPNYRLTDVYPNGFSPSFGVKTDDASIVSGVKGKLSNSLSWDVSGRYGESKVNYLVSNTINASLGPLSPTRFDAGTNVQKEYAANADFNWLLDAGLVTPVSISFGGEWRRESYEIRTGDKASYVVGPFADLTPGSNGFPGPTPDQAGRWSRSSRAAYLDLDLDVTEQLNLGGALRFENFDSFGSTWNYKFSARYKVAPVLSVRGAFSTGFHAPTVGQQNLTATSQGPDPDIPPPAEQVIITSGLIPSTNPIALTVGGQPLVPEKATNISAGIVLAPAAGLTVSVDYYRIKVRDRLGVTSTQRLTAGQRATLEAAGVSQATYLTNFNFFINGFDTRTQGVDVVASYVTRLGQGRASFTAAYNYNKTRLLNGDPRVVSPTLVASIEKRQPNHTATASADYEIGRLSFSARGRYYGSFSDVKPYFPADRAQRFSPKFFTDVSAAYALTDAVKLTLGVDNLFDIYPDENRPDLAAYGHKYPLSRPYEADGGRYYARFSAKF